MATTTFNRCITLFMCLSLMTTNLFSQESTYKLSMSKQVELSKLIIEGEVISKNSFWDDAHQSIYTSHTIKIFKVFKGQEIETINIITQGGVVGLEAVVVSNSLQIRNGDIGVFMLSDRLNNQDFNSGNNDPNFKSISDNQGFYKYSFEKNRAVNTFNVIENISGNFYNQLLEETKTNIIEVNDLNFESRVSQVQNTNRVTATISSFSATDFSAGTKSTLTINGSGFGTTQGTIGFSNANYGGAIHSDALDNQIISWSNTKVEVEIPDLAGTGSIVVNTSSNGSIESTQVLTIDFAQINIETNIGSGETAYQTQHIETNNNGGITWIMNTAFSNSNANNAFQRGFENWSCQTGINWGIDSATTSTTSAGNDGENVITFDPNLSSGTLGRCTSYYSGCLVNGTVQWYVTEMDIVFNNSINWNFDTNAPVSGEMDFESVVVHELGHGHQLGHVIDNSEIMHYSLTYGTQQRILSNEDLAGALDVQSRSTTTTVCNQVLMNNSSCYEQSLAAEGFEILNNIKLYPNPAQDNFFIKNNTFANIDSISVYNILGKLVLTTYTTNPRLSKINLSNYAAGMYLVKINTDLGILTKKLILK